MCVGGVRVCVCVWVLERVCVPGECVGSVIAGVRVGVPARVCGERVCAGAWVCVGACAGGSGGAWVVRVRVWAGGGVCSQKIERSVRSDRKICDLLLC